MKKQIRNTLMGLALAGMTSTAVAQADIPVLGAVLSGNLALGNNIPGLPGLIGLPGLDGLPEMDGLPGLDALGGAGGGGLPMDILPGIPVVSAVLNGAALEGSGPVLTTILSPEFLTDPTPVLMLLSPEALADGSALVMGIVGGLSESLTTPPALPGL